MALPPSVWTFTNNTRANILTGDNNWSTSGAFKIALFTSAASLGPAVATYSSIAANEVASGNGYTTGGKPVTLTLTGTTALTVKFSSTVVWTGATSGFSAYYAAVYNISSDEVIAYSVLDSTPQNVVVGAAATLTIDNTVTPFATLS